MNGPWRISPPLPAERFAEVRRRTIFDHCKWDPQVEDISALSPSALVLPSTTWDELGDLAEQLYAETLAAERELLQSPALLGRLGLPRAITAQLRQRHGTETSVPAWRVMRFDFHWTTDGWRVSEVNSDVPGGYIESSGFTDLMAAHFSGTRSSGDPADAVVAAASALGPAASRDAPLVGLVHATAYVDDRQVMIYLARRFAACGITSILCGPDEIMWREGVAYIRQGDAAARELQGVFRFYPAEWLPQLGGKPWRNYFHPTRTLACNPGWALLSQSKRFPLVWPYLRTPLPVWRALLPETVDPRCVPWQRDPSWVVKPALGRVGEDIGMHGITEERAWRKIRRWAKWFPGHWVAQRRFTAIPIRREASDGFPVLGVYVVNGRRCGIYGRMALRPLIDHRAQDLAVLVAQASETQLLPAPRERRPAEFTGSCSSSSTTLASPELP